MTDRALTCALFALFVATATHADAQTRYATGQDVAPVFEGWEPNPDGSFNMVFGYMNRNYEEQPEIPIGPNNMFEPGEPDQGQPTHFYNRRQEFVFKVKVSRDWGDKDLTWTLTSRGEDKQSLWDAPASLGNLEHGVSGKSRQRWRFIVSRRA